MRVIQISHFKFFLNWITLNSILLWCSMQQTTAVYMRQNYIHSTLRSLPRDTSNRQLLYLPSQFILNRDIREKQPISVYSETKYADMNLQRVKVPHTNVACRVSNSQSSRGAGGLSAHDLGCSHRWPRMEKSE